MNSEPDLSNKPEYMRLCDCLLYSVPWDPGPGDHIWHYIDGRLRDEYNL